MLPKLLLICRLIAVPLGPLQVHIAVGQEGDLLARQQSGLLRPARCCRCQSPSGLDTRCERLQGYAHWYDLDLPETIAVRKKLLPGDGAVSQIVMSAMDNWDGKITQHGAPALVIIEGLTMYLSEADIKRIFTMRSKRFARVRVLVR